MTYVMTRSELQDLAKNEDYSITVVHQKKRYVSIWVLI